MTRRLQLSLFALLVLSSAAQIFAPAGAIRRVSLFSLILGAALVIRGAIRLGTHRRSKVYIALMAVGCLLLLIAIGLPFAVDPYWLLLAGINLLVIGAMGYSVYFSRRIREDIRDQN